MQEHLEATAAALLTSFLRRTHFSQPSDDGLSVCNQDAWKFDRPNDPGHTFDVENPLVRDGEVATAVSRKIDHILVRGGWHGPSLRVMDCRRILDGPVHGVWASDHYGVLADLALPRNPPGFRS
ncbi:MAG: hypothetical protein AVDCRST_MAG60-2118 [uncultured Nocardioides sp.]|uniref:Endonuclease/exonuclease/phosphatase domain-containing protein n=1 Tax=uncultured Nocardioides sp. TaxID=198441 RepID=A0A6J4P5L3_9ACTN|nr:MAG: hypothetical protein AVDCRST_MAG60-2118 [uncultured Nocardioides sp.]